MGSLHIKEYPKLFKQTFSEFIKDDPMKYAAALAYYTVFSLPGILILTLYIAGIFLGDKAVSGQLASQAENLIGSGAAEQIENILKNAAQPANSMLMKIVGIGTLIFSATTAFGALQDALNAMWEVKPKPEKGWLRLIISRLLSMAMIVTIGFLLLVSLGAEALLGVLKSNMQEIIPSLSYPVMYVLNLAISLVVITFLFAVVYKVLPDAKVKWRNVWFGAGFTTVLFILGKFLIGFYLGKSDFSSTYGAAGSLVVILAWVYYSSIILLLGAEFTQVYSRLTESRIQPAEHAVRVKVSEVEMID